MEPAVLVGASSDRRRASLSVKLRAASAPGPVRGVSDEGEPPRDLDSFGNGRFDERATEVDVVVDDSNPV